jgi:predicted transcriptional regulator
MSGLKREPGRSSREKDSLHNAERMIDRHAEAQKARLRASRDLDAVKGDPTVSDEEKRRLARAMAESVYREGCAACSFADLETAANPSYLSAIHLKSRQASLLQEIVASPTRLTRTDLALRLNMSRTTVNNYLAILEGHNLVYWPEGSMAGVAATHEGYVFIEQYGPAGQ